MDINPFEIAGKTVRRTYETVQDSYNYMQSSIWNWIPGKPFNGIKQEASDDIMSAAKTALQHDDDLAEASHQLKRELYFSSLVDDLANSGNERAARAGLNAIKQGHSAAEVNAVLQSAGQEREAINSIKQHFDKDLGEACRDSLELSALVQRDARSRLPQLGQDSAWLARTDLAFAEYKIQHLQYADAQLAFSDAEKYIQLASKNGMAMRQLQGEADRTKLLLPQCTAGGVTVPERDMNMLSSNPMVRKP